MGPIQLGRESPLQMGLSYYQELLRIKYLAFDVSIYSLQHRTGQTPGSTLELDARFAFEAQEYKSHHLRSVMLSLYH